MDLLVFSVVFENGLKQTINYRKSLVWITVVKDYYGYAMLWHVSGKGAIARDTAAVSESILIPHELWIDMHKAQAIINHQRAVHFFGFGVRECQHFLH
jgi:hypothetical protein